MNNARFLSFSISVSVILYAAIAAVTLAQAPPGDGKPTPVAEEPQPAVAAAQDKIKVVFDDANPGVVYVESNGERIRVDVNRKTVEKAALAAPSAPVEAEAEAAKPVEESAYAFDEGEEPY